MALTDVLRNLGPVAEGDPLEELASRISDDGAKPEDVPMVVSRMYRKMPGQTRALRPVPAMLAYMEAAKRQEDRLATMGIYR